MISGELLDKHLPRGGRVPDWDMQSQQGKAQIRALVDAAIRNGWARRPPPQVEPTPEHGKRGKPNSGR